MATSHLSLIIPVYNRPNEVEELLDSLTPVSYTHLDVYKRQVHSSYRTFD